MTKPEAIQDAKDRAERTGLIWNVILFREGFWINLYRWICSIQEYETTSEEHYTFYKELYVSGKFELIETICPIELNNN